MTQKMYCIFAQETLDKMKGLRGKLASMAGHAYLHSYWDAITGGIPLANHNERFRQAQDYKNSDKAYKITLVVDTIEELKEIQSRYREVCGTSLVTDAGKTVFGEPTTVCLGLGPIDFDLIGDDIKALRTLT